MDTTTVRREWSATIVSLFPDSDECVFPLIERAIDKEVGPPSYLLSFFSVSRFNPRRPRFLLYTHSVRGTAVAGGVAHGGPSGRIRGLHQTPGSAGAPHQGNHEGVRLPANRKPNGVLHNNPNRLTVALTFWPPLSRYCAFVSFSPCRSCSFLRFQRKCCSVAHRRFASPGVLIGPIRRRSWREALTRWLEACSEKMFKAVLEVIEDSPKCPTL
jgi:hypothetical protein